MVLRSIFLFDSNNACKTIEVLPALVQWIDRQPDDVPIGDAIDALRSILE
jgi:hypothetical protein